MTDLERKLWLASKLPELIHPWENGPGQKLFSWADTQQRITEREWDCVVREVEKLTDANPDEPDSLRFRYAAELYRNTVPDDQQPFRATWQQRCDALRKVMQ